MKSSDSLPNERRESSLKSLAGGVSGALARFERNPSTKWLLEGETTSSGELNHVFVNSSPFRVGRHSSNNLTISNRTVSGQHAELTLENEELLVRDLGSTNGTFLNGKRVRSSASLADGDIIHFGKVRFHVRGNQESMPRATLAFDAEVDALAHLQFASLWDGEGLNPHFQPIVRLEDKRIVAFEALARSDFPGLESPYEMFQIAKQHKAEAELSVLLRQASLEKAERLLAGHSIYLNTHPAEMGRNELFISLEQLRGQNPSASIVLEVHEGGTMSIEYLEELKNKLAELDMKLAYDDFGRGQSRLNALAETPPDIVKFDIELVQGLHEASAKRRRLVRSLLKIVKALNGLTLAEGVEKPEEAEICEELGFDLAQGFYYGRPAPAEEWLDQAACADLHNVR